ncbi:hypothetical protein K443DRAFT_113803, partial [Laccaria amethystina LaAM-08-1]
IHCPLLCISKLCSVYWPFVPPLPYLEMHTDHVHTTLTLSTIVNTMSIQFFCFLAIFLLVTIFGNAHRPCR